MIPNQRTLTHSALHVLKGAARRVLNTKWTAGVYVEGLHGRLTLKAEKPPTDSEIVQVEQLANDEISAGVQIEELEMERAEAERRWGDDIYDLFPLPSGITHLRILRIPDWNVNACREPHTQTTAEIGAIRITKTRYRAAKQLLELSFDVQTG